MSYKKYLREDKNIHHHLHASGIEAVAIGFILGLMADVIIEFIGCI